MSKKLKIHYIESKKNTKSLCCVAGLPSNSTTTFKDNVTCKNCLSLLERPKNGNIESGKYVTIFTDASYDVKIKAAGWAGWVKYGDPAKTYRTSGKALNVPKSHLAERLAIDLTISAMIENGIDIKNKVVIVQSDCKGMLEKYSSPLLSKALKVILRHVKGHNGKRCKRSAVNTWCDQEARIRLSEIRRAAVQK